MRKTVFYNINTINKLWVYEHVGYGIEYSSKPPEEIYKRNSHFMFGGFKVIGVWEKKKL